jgi:hypothetical protein
MHHRQYASAAGSASTACGGENGSRPCAADDSHFRDTAGEGALGRFEFQNHSAGHLVAANQVLDFLSLDGAKHFFAVEHARNVCKKDQAVGSDEFGSGSGHVVGVDVVEFAISAKTEAARDRNNSGTPVRAQEIEIHAG